MKAQSLVAINIIVIVSVQACYCFLNPTTTVRHSIFLGRTTMQRQMFDSNNNVSKKTVHHYFSQPHEENRLSSISKLISRHLLATFVFTAILNLSPIVPLSPTTVYHTSPQVQRFHIPDVALAADYGSLTVEQKAVAEAWRIVDNNFFDRTFNNQDWFQIRQDAVKKKYKSMEEANAAIDQIVSSLGDKYTRYLPMNKYKSIVDSATGTLAGIGVELSTDPTSKRVLVSDVEANSPASKSGLKAGDVFVEVDGVRMDDGQATPDDVAGKIRGPEGTKIGLVVQRNGNPIDFILTREPITITSVKSYLSTQSPSDGGKVGVIRIKSFSGTTASLVSDAISELKKKGATAFVLDVRGNPGGLLPGGVATASLFLDANKPIVFVVDKKGTIDSQVTFTPGIDVDSTLVVFTNGNTASAAEVMTAALKENGRAVVVGEKTFGKGIVQTIRQLSYDNGGVAVTVARYETPLHHDINKQGIQVDFQITGCPVDGDAVSCIPLPAFEKARSAIYVAT